MINSIKDLKSVSCGGSLNFVEDLGFSLEDYDKHGVFVDNRDDLIVFKMMTKPASQGGTGCQLTDLIEVALHQLKFLNDKYSCVQNDSTIICLESALRYQRERTRDREQRNVEGMSRE